MDFPRDIYSGRNSKSSVLVMLHFLPDVVDGVQITKGRKIRKKIKIKKELENDITQTNSSDKYRKQRATK
jgi:hypothetical protein